MFQKITNHTSPNVFVDIQVDIGKQLLEQAKSFQKSNAYLEHQRQRSNTTKRQQIGEEIEKMASETVE